MRVGSLMLLLVAAPLAAQAQSAAPLPPDIHPVTLSRLPPVTPEDLDDEARRLFNERDNFTPGPGPTHVTVYIPRERSLGIPTGEIGRARVGKERRARGRADAETEKR